MARSRRVRGPDGRFSSFSAPASNLEQRSGLPDAAASHTMFGLESLFYTVGTRHYPVGISCGLHRLIVYPVGDISRG